MTTSLLDTAVLVYAIGGDHPLREPCRALLTAVGSGTLQAAASTLAVHELLHQRTRRVGDRATAVQQVRPLLDALDLLPADAAAARLSLDLYASSARLDAADAMHAAVALTNGITTIVSPDTAFDDVDGLERIDPRDALANG